MAEKHLPPDQVDQAANHLLVLTLALEAALGDANYSDAQALFAERASVIEALAGASTSGRKAIEQVQGINRRIEQSMLCRSRELALELTKGFEGRRAHQAYQPNPRANRGQTA